MRPMRWVYLTVLAALLVGVAGCGSPKADEAPAAPAAGTTDGAQPAEGAATATPAAGEEVVIEDVMVGEGPEAADGDLLLVTYTGKLAKDGTEFDSNDKPDGKPFAVRLGLGSVIKGWEEGLQGMKAGGERNLTIPYAKAYGEAGSPPRIPARADLNFNVKLLHIVKAGDEQIYDRKDVKTGTGAAVKSGDRVQVHYVGTYVNGLKFDSSRDRNEPFTFTVGKGEVIAGWDAGVVGMKVGGRRELIIPPALAYGSNPQNPIGADQVLRFDIELLKIN